jgi:hypothetical protein
MKIREFFSTGRFYPVLTRFKSAKTDWKILTLLVIAGIGLAVTVVRAVYNESVL